MVAGNCSEKDIELAQEIISKGEVLIAVWKPKPAEVQYYLDIVDECCPSSDHLTTTLTILTNKKLYRHVMESTDASRQYGHKSGFVHLDDIKSESVKTMTGKRVALGGWSDGRDEWPILSRTEARCYPTGRHYMWFICDDFEAAAQLIKDAIDAIDDAGVDSIHERIGYLDALGMMPVHMPQAVPVMPMEMEREFAMPQAMPVMPMEAVSIVTTDIVREVGGGPTSSIADEINKLADLQATGLLTAEQFETAKNKVIQSI